MRARPTRTDGEAPYISPLEVAVAFSVDLSAALGTQSILAASVTGSTWTTGAGSGHPYPGFVQNLVPSAKGLALVCGDGQQRLGSDVEVTIALTIDSTPQATWTLYVDIPVRKGQSAAEAAAQAHVLASVGDPNGTLAAALPGLWESYASAGPLDPTLALQALYVRRAALDIRLAEEHANVTFNAAGDVSDNQSDRSKHLNKMREATQTEIERKEAIIGQSAGGTSGPLAATELSRPAAAGSRDAADAGLRGSPYVRPLRPT